MLNVLPNYLYAIKFLKVTIHLYQNNINAIVKLNKYLKFKLVTFQSTGKSTTSNTEKKIKKISKTSTTQSKTLITKIHLKKKRRNFRNDPTTIHSHKLTDAGDGQTARDGKKGRRYIISENNNPTSPSGINSPRLRAFFPPTTPPPAPRPSFWNSRPSGARKTLVRCHPPLRGWTKAEDNDMNYVWKRMKQITFECRRNGRAFCARSFFEGGIVIFFFGRVLILIMFSYHIFCGNFRVWIIWSFFFSSNCCL